MLDPPTHHILDQKSHENEAEVYLDDECDSPKCSEDHNQHKEDQELKEQEEDEEGEEKGSSVGTDEDSLPELFQPSSPLQISKNFILPDIMEESENDQSESMRSSIISADGTINRSPVKQDDSNFDPFEETGLDVIETNFNDDVPLPDFDDVTDDQQFHNVSGSPQEPPILPVSPPPGPLLSPRFSMMSEHASDPNRFSVVSVSNEMPPPLPISLPPGKLIPRESMYQDSEAQVDLWYHLMRGTHEESNVGAQLEDGSTNELGTVITSEGHVGCGQHPQLAHHLTSDSGFPDTDMTTIHSDHSTNRTTENAVSCLHHLLSIPNKNGSTSATSYSDERTTECSGSVGLKTNASSVSQVSL